MKKFRFIRQKDSMQCGVACLAMIAGGYGRQISLSALSKICRPSAEGVSLAGMMQGAKAMGMKATPVKASLRQISGIETGRILHWNQNHFVVLVKVTRRGRYRIADPGKGILDLSREDFCRHWLGDGYSDTDAAKGIALLLEPGPDFLCDATAGKEEGEDRSLGFVTRYILKYLNCFLQIAFGLLLGCVLQLALPFLTQWIVDFGIRNNNLSLIWLILLGELMIVAGRTATDFIRRWLLLHISMRVNISIVSNFFIKLLRLPMAFFDTRNLGDIMQRIGDHDRIRDFLTNQVLNSLFTFLSFMVFGVVLLVYSGLVFLIFLLGSFAYALWVASFLRKRKVIDYELFGQLAANQNRTYQFITSMQEIKLQGCERRRRWEWEDTQADLFEVQLKSLRLQQTQEAGSIFINEIKNILITVFAATAVINGQISLGAMLAIQYIVGQLNSPVEQLMQFVYSLQDVRISLERINEIHSGRDEEPDRGMATEFAAGRGIRLEGVDFRYDPHSLRRTLTDVSLEVPEGKVTAIVGASGSGKTTLVKLMLGYYPPETGRLTVAGRDIGDYSMRWWRSRCGAVMQDGVIFSESIERNIAVGDGEVDRVRLEHAARIACIHDYVMSLPLRYNTMIGRDGVGLSQGQKQRILIARAVYRDPDFIFLDEATNALDAENERAIVENLSGFYRGRTVVVVAHRLSTVRNADRIIVMDGGRVVETGDHVSLTARKGAYYNLVRNQLELGT